MQQRYRLQILCSLAGILVGYLLLHPYTMLIYAVMHLHQEQAVDFRWQELSAKALAAFHPMMLPMGIPFALFGGVIGLLIGVLLKRRKKLFELQHEHEKKKIALETLHEVMVTLAHHLLNANMIIGGKVRHCRKAISDHDILAALEVIEEQGRKIDVVVGALRKATEIKVGQYTSDGSVKMIDISKEIEDQIQQSQKPA